MLRNIGREDLNRIDVYLFLCFPVVRIMNAKEREIDSDITRSHSLMCAERKHRRINA